MMFYEIIDEQGRFCGFKVEKGLDGQLTSHTYSYLHARQMYKDMGQTLGLEAKKMDIVLIAEDNESTRQLLKDIAESLGYTPLVTPDAYCAFDEYLALDQNGGDSRRVLLTDNNMPGMTGTTLSEKVHNYEFEKYGRRITPIVMLTGDDRVQQTPCIDILMRKPPELNDLENALTTSFSKYDV